MIFCNRETGHKVIAGKIHEILVYDETAMIILGHIEYNYQRRVPEAEETEIYFVNGKGKWRDKIAAQFKCGELHTNSFALVQVIERKGNLYGAGICAAGGHIQEVDPNNSSVDILFSHALLRKEVKADGTGFYTIDLPIEDYTVAVSFRDGKKDIAKNARQIINNGSLIAVATKGIYKKVVEGEVHLVAEGTGFELMHQRKKAVKKNTQSKFTCGERPVPCCAKDFDLLIEDISRYPIDSQEIAEARLIMTATMANYEGEGRIP